MQSRPTGRPLALDRYAERGADASEQIGYQSDQGAVAQTGDGRRVDAVEQRAHFQGIEHRRLPRRHDVPGPCIDPAGLTGIGRSASEGDCSYHFKVVAEGMRFELTIGV
jgi:hypothetical protein